MDTRDSILMVLIFCISAIAILQITSDQRTIDDLEVELSDMREKNAIQEQTILVRDYEIQQLHNRIDEAQNKTQEVNSKLSRSSIYYVPTPEQVREFLKADNTEMTLWTPSYDCTEISYDLVESFQENNMIAHVVEIDHPDSAHMIVSVNTTEGIMLIEPQTDEILSDNLIGEQYCRDWWICDYNSTVTKISGVNILERM